MYTAYPDPEPTTTDVIEIPDEVKAEAEKAKLYGKIQRFVETHTAADFSGLSPQAEKTQYTHNSKALKLKGGKPPKDYALVEDFVDLQLFVLAEDFVSALPYYFRLSRLTC